MPLLALLLAAATPPPDFTAAAAERFANLALACVHKEYPNKLAHVLNGPRDARPPHELTPAFFGCYDWHSSVHGHWLLARLASWLPKLTRPIRIGEHDQTAFAFGLVLDWARGSGDAAMEQLLLERTRAFYGADRACPLTWEPNGQDFLSPCLAEADLLRRVLPAPEYARWLSTFLPSIPLSPLGERVGERADLLWLSPAVVTDRADPKLAHLDGLNLSRAWMLDGLLSALPPDDPRRPALTAAAAAHRAAGLEAVTGEHYEGGHWLGSFAVYLVTRRGLR